MELRDGGAQVMGQGMLHSHSAGFPRTNTRRHFHYSSFKIKVLSGCLKLNFQCYFRSMEYLSSALGPCP